MSCDWDIKCLDCGVEAGICANHGDYAIKCLIEKGQAALTFLGKACPNAEISLMSFNIYSENGQNLACAWFAAHQNHELVPFNEYGETYDEYRAKWETERKAKAE